MSCNLCGLNHRGWVSCAKAKRDADLAINTGVPNTEPLTASIEEDVIAGVNAVGVNMPTGVNRHGKHKDQEAHRVWMREYMRKRRAV